MVDYIYNTIMMSADEPNQITARISDEAGPITAGCNLRVYRDGVETCRVNGAYTSGLWVFDLPAMEEAKYQYAFFHNDESLDFQNDLYSK